MNLSNLQKLAQDLGLKSDDLDETVHDLVSKQASSINNGGLDEQVEFLVGEVGEKEAEKILRDIAKR